MPPGSTYHVSAAACFGQYLFPGLSLPGFGKLNTAKFLGRASHSPLPGWFAIYPSGRVRRDNVICPGAGDGALAPMATHGPCILRNSWRFGGHLHPLRQAKGTNHVGLAILVVEELPIW